MRIDAWHGAVRRWPSRLRRDHCLMAFCDVPAMERARGFEPPTFCLGSRHSATELRPHGSNRSHSTKRRILYQPQFAPLHSRRARG